MRKMIKQFVMALTVLWTVGMAMVIPVWAEERTQEQEYQQDSNSRDLEEMETGNFKLTLTDGEDKDQKLSGGVFVVYEKAGGEKVKELVTDKDGRASVELPIGDYTLQEIVAPEGYCLSGEGVNVSVQAGEIWELAFSNEKEVVADRENLNRGDTFEEKPGGKSTDGESTNNLNFAI